MVTTTPLPPIDEDPVLFKLRSQEHGTGNKPIVLIGVGLAVTIILSIVLAVATAFLLYLLADSAALGVRGWFFVWLLPMIAAGVWIDRQTRGRYWADTWTGEGDDRPDETPIPFWKKYLTLAFIGPRLIVGGLQRLQKTPASEHEKFLFRCNTFIRDLAGYGEAVIVTRLVKIGETPTRIDHLMDYLDNRRWVGHNSDRTKVWLASDAKSNLIRWGLMDATAA